MEGVSKLQPGADVGIALAKWFLSLDFVEFHNTGLKFGGKLVLVVFIKHCFL